MADTQRKSDVQFEPDTSQYVHVRMDTSNSIEIPITALDNFALNKISNRLDVYLMFAEEGTPFDMSDFQLTYNLAAQAENLLPSDPNELADMGINHAIRSRLAILIEAAAGIVESSVLETDTEPAMQVDSKIASLEA